MLHTGLLSCIHSPCQKADTAKSFITNPQITKIIGGGERRVLLKEEIKRAPRDFGRTLKDIRTKRGYTREQLAERVGISTRYLSAIENEQREPSYNVLYHLFHSLGISADTIFYSHTENTNNSDAEQVKRLYMECSERDRLIVRTLLDSLLDHK